MASSGARLFRWERVTEQRRRSPSEGFAVQSASGLARRRVDDDGGPVTALDMRRRRLPLDPLDPRVLERPEEVAGRSRMGHSLIAFEAADRRVTDAGDAPEIARRPTEEVPRGPAVLWLQLPHAANLPRNARKFQNSAFVANVMNMLAL